MILSETQKHASLLFPFVCCKRLSVLIRIFLGKKEGGRKHLSVLLVICCNSQILFPFAMRSKNDQNPHVQLFLATGKSAGH